MDIEALLQDVSPEEPCGADLESDPAFLALEKKLEGTPEDPFANRPAQPPNWGEVRSDAVELLGRTHDLRVVVTLLRALIHTEGLPGLRDGLALLRAFLEQCWDTLYPRLDPTDLNDPTQRVNILSALNDLEAVLQPIGLAAIIESPQAGRFTVRDLRIATGRLPVPQQAEGVPQLAAIEAAFADAELERLRALRDATSGSLGSLSGIETFVAERVGAGSAPGFSVLRDVLQEIGQFVSAQLEHRGAVGGPAAGEDILLADTAAGGTDRAEGVGQVGVIRSRQDVLRALGAICEYYARNEPSSPVPLLLQRARNLASKDFLEIIRDMAPDSLSRIQLIAGSEGSPDAS